PDVLDPVPCDVERGHRHGDAVLLSDQAGLAVDRALQDRQAGCPVGGGEHVARDPLGAFDRAERDGVGQAAAVGDHGGGGIAVAAGWRWPRGALMSWASQACLKALTMPAWRAAGAVGAFDARMRRRAEEASWRHAAGVRPTISATSAKE